VKSFLALLLTIAILAGCQSSKSSFDHTLIPNEQDFQSVLYLNDHAGHVASGFLHSRNGRLYIVTAKHFACYMSQKDSIGIFLDGQWDMVPTRLIGHAKGDVDISVFAFDFAMKQPAIDLSPSLTSTDSLSLGCDVWYLGFPLGYLDDNPERRYPYPLLKHGYLSTRSGHPLLYYFDGYCNVGFSGGPVFARTTQGNLRLIGIVSFRVEENVGIGTTNAGIFTAYSSEYADSLIDENPVGTPLLK
jgi:hypothetical protein